MHKIIHAPIDVIESELGELDVTELKIFMRHKSSVINNAILPGTTSGGIRKLICN